MWDKEIEGTFTQAWKKLKDACAASQNVSLRYGKKNSEVWTQGKQLLDGAMIVVSEALVVKALTGKDAATNVAAQLRRMSANRVGAIASPLMVEANRIVTGRQSAA